MDPGPAEAVRPLDPGADQRGADPFRAMRGIDPGGRHPGRVARPDIEVRRDHRRRPEEHRPVSGDKGERDRIAVEVRSNQIIDDVAREPLRLPPRAPHPVGDAGSEIRPLPEIDQQETVSAEEA